MAENELARRWWRRRLVELGKHHPRLKTRAQQARLTPEVVNECCLQDSGEVYTSVQHATEQEETPCHQKDGSLDEKRHR